jgi:hypothetical protein
MISKTIYKSDYKFIQELHTALHNTHFYRRLFLPFASLFFIQLLHSFFLRISDYIILMVDFFSLILPFYLVFLPLSSPTAPRDLCKYTLSVMAQITTQRHLTADPNGNHDSGYVPSNVAEDGLVSSQLQHTPPDSPKPNATIIVNRNATTNNKRNGSPRKEPLR